MCLCGYILNSSNTGSDLERLSLGLQLLLTFFHSNSHSNHEIIFSLSVYIYIILCNTIILRFSVGLLEWLFE